MPKRSCKSLANKLYESPGKLTQSIVPLLATIDPAIYFAIMPPPSAKLSSHPVQHYAAPDGLHLAGCQMQLSPCCSALSGGATVGSVTLRIIWRCKDS